jgi:hypothetical protein
MELPGVSFGRDAANTHFPYINKKGEAFLLTDYKNPSSIRKSWF